MTSNPGSEGFTGNDRFTIQRCLGSGAFGVVYQAHDRDRDAIVALKTLIRADPAALFLFKQEFRALTDVVHPNLVQLHELLSDGEQWFFTMELVDGSSFLDWARGAASDGPGFSTRRMTISSSPSDSDAEVSLPAPPAPPAEPDRLRRGLVQLGEGLVALHRAGMLHRDIKPHNVLVTKEGRVVLLDFGLAADLGPHRSHQSSGLHTVGTPAYMSPEQAAGLPVTEASDWYSVGVVLYEALTGRLPFGGRPLEILMEKQRREPVPPRSIAPDAPEDLDRLTVELLHRDPEDRPAGDEILHRLHSGPRARLSPRRASRSSGSRPALLVGRDGALQDLQDALLAVKSGKPVVVFVTGPSGIGKSTLAKRFLETTRAEDDGVVVLSGRCYERESVPYKALDSLVDSLSQYLRRLSPLEIEAVLPRDVLALARLFPVLRRVEAVAGAKRRVLHIPDSQELRRRAFAALRELLGRLSDRATPILFIDDLQWGDADSAALLAELLRPPEPPALLFIGALRDEARTSGLRASLQFPMAMGEAPDVREIALDPLSSDDAETLAAALLGDPRPESRELARSIARATRGNPYFIDELVRTGQASSGDDETLRAPEEATLEGLIRARAARLPDEARRLLEVVAVAGGPIDRHVAKTAASLDGEGAQALALLQTARLVRPRASRQRDEIETVHDQVRQSILAGLDESALAALHTRLAIALEASGRADPEALAEHWLLGGDVERASEFVTKAAEQAVEALAFDRAARLFRRALDGQLITGDEARRLQIALGDALANGGRGSEAAEVYLAAAEGAKAAEALELKRRAAEQLLRSGHIDAGLAALRSVLSAVGLKLAESPRRALVSLLATRAFLALRGLKYVERDATEIAASQLMKIDICWSVAVGLGIVDTLRGSDFQARHLLLALRSGEPYRVARALAVEVGYSATGGSRAAARTARLIETTAALARRVAPPHALGLATFTAGLAAYLEGRWRRAHDLCEESEAIFREKCTNVAWELGNAHFYSLRSLFHLGQLDELARRLPKILKDVKERGDLYTETNLRTRVAYVPYLAGDDAVAARGEVRAIVDRWSHQGFHLQHYFDLFGQAEIDLYAGDGAAAWKRVSKTWPALQHSLFQRIELIFIESHHLHGRAALGAASAGGDPALVALADADARLIETRAGAAWGRPFAALLTAGAASIRGETRRAVDALLSAESGFEADEMALAAAVARWCRGRLVPGAEGKTLVEDAEAWMKRQRILRPDRMAMMMAPGKWEAGL